MDDLLTRFWSDLVGRVSGPLSFRLILQPVMASIFAVRDGLNDAKHGRPAYLWTMLTDDGQRRPLLSEGWHAVFRIILLGTIMDVAYQVMVFRRLRPIEIVVVVLALAFAPYVLLRGPINRIARHWFDSGRGAATG